MSESELLSIGRFARLTGLSIGALRHYDEMGLLPPAAVSPETGYRSYRRDQAATALLIARMRDLEMPLPEIRALLAAAPAEREQRLRAHRDRMEARAFRLHFILHQLNQEEPMSASPTKPDVLDPDTHRQTGAHLFNHVWSLLEMEDRTTAQDDEMLHAAHASRWHWAQTGVPDLNQRAGGGGVAMLPRLRRAGPRRAVAAPRAPLRGAGRGRRHGGLGRRLRLRGHGARLAHGGRPPRLRGVARQGPRGHGGRSRIPRTAR